MQSMDEITKHHFTNIATGKAKKNNDGSLSTVVTRQVDLPDERGKRVPTLIPSLYDGKILTEKEATERAIASGKKWPTAKTHPELRKFDEKIHERMHDRTTPEEAAAELIRAADKETVNMNEGGMTLTKQMELFEPVERGFDEGGLMDEGGTVDPVSGNDVPPGSTQEEVRDDIPAQLSEGEFVFPADVVRYIGLENLMRMRQEAKQGLAQMDAMGQMGNSEEATVEDDLPFDMYDLDVEDDSLAMQQGGFVNPQTGTYKMPGTGITGFQQAPASTTGFTPNQPIQPYFKPTQFTQAQYQDPLQVTNIPTFGETVGTGLGQYDEMKTYVNDAGQVIQVPFKDGKPIYPIPEGYRPQGDQPTAEQPTTPTTTLGQTSVRDDGGASGDNPVDDGLGPSGARVGWGGTTKGAKKGLKVGSTMVGLGYTKVDPKTGKPSTGLSGVPNALDFANVIGGLAFGDELPAGYAATMTIDNVTTPINNQFFNEAKKNGYMGKSADLSLERARTNVQAANIMQSKYGLGPRNQAKAINDIAKEAARSDVGIAELAKEYGIDIETIKDNPFGFGKNYNDAIAKAVEIANTNRKDLRPDGKGTFDKGTDPFTADDIKNGHAARTAIDAHNDAVNAKAAAQRAADRDSGGDDGGAGTAMGSDPGAGGNVGDAATAEATGVGTGSGGSNEYDSDAGYD